LSGAPPQMSLAFQSKLPSYYLRYCRTAQNKTGIYKFHRSQPPIYEAGSLYKYPLPPVPKHFSPTEDKEKLNPNPVEPRHDTARRYSRRNPLQDHSDKGTNADGENSEYRECYTIHDRELHTANTGPNPAKCYTFCQEYTATEVNIVIEDSDINKNREC